MNKIRFSNIYLQSILAGAYMVLVFSISGCSTESHKTRHLVASTDFNVFIPPTADGYNLPPNQKIVLGEPIAQPPPIYPERLLSLHIHQQTVCLEIEINQIGQVYASRPLFSMVNCPANSASVMSAFILASQNAVYKWRFYPSKLCTFPTNVNASQMNNDCIAYGAKVENISIKLAFIFTFKQTSTGASVSIIGLNSKS